MKRSQSASTPARAHQPSIESDLRLAKIEIVECGHNGSAALLPNDSLQFGTPPYLAAPLPNKIILATAVYQNNDTRFWQSWNFGVAGPIPLWAKNRINFTSTASVGYRDLRASGSSACHWGFGCLAGFSLGCPCCRRPDYPATYRPVLKPKTTAPTFWHAFAKAQSIGSREDNAPAHPRPVIF